MKLEKTPLDSLGTAYTVITRLGVRVEVIVPDCTPRPTVARIVRDMRRRAKQYDERVRYRQRVTELAQANKGKR